LKRTTRKIPPHSGRKTSTIYRSGTGASLLGIYNFPGAAYATDGSNDKAGYFKLDEHRGGCCLLGRGEEGNSSKWAELGAAYLALEDAKRKQDRKPIILLSNSACFLSSSQKWVGEGKSRSMHGNPDADIMRDIVQLLQERIEQGLPTIFIKIKAHRGDPLNELSDRWADEGRQSENIRWSLLTNRPIFYWSDNGIMHHSPVNSTVKKRIDLQVPHKINSGSTANFLTREESSRTLLGKFHKDRSVWIRARQRVLQCLSCQFPCALQLKQWGVLNGVKCRLCEKYCKEKNTRDPPDTVESVGHIQCYCPVLQLPRIAIHYGIWRELMFSIRKSSTELNDASEPRWHFPSALSPEAHAEWGLYKILEYMGLHEITGLPLGAGQNRVKLRKDIEEYHIAAIDFDDTDIDTFMARRPDGLAFDKEKNYVYSWNTPEPWTRMKTGQRRRTRRKMTYIAPI